MFVLRLNESLQSIKSRNKKFWWMAKTLRETVQCFGDNGSPSGQQLRGPFYASYYTAIHIPEFNIRLNSPVSTSKHIEVVTRFMSTYRDSKGIIITLNNNGDYDSSRYLRSFNLSWISKYKEEDERIFMGSDWRIRIETIGVISGFQNYQRYFRSLFIFDCMVSGSDLDDKKDVRSRPSSAKISKESSKKSTTSKAANGSKRLLSKPSSPPKASTPLNKVCDMLVEVYMI